MELPELVEGRLIRRYKRFLADVELADGHVVTAHCPNPGSMKGMKRSGAEVWLSQSSNPKRKLAYTWELIRAQGAMTLVNTGRANAIVAEGMQNSSIAELAGFQTLHAEVPYGKSRIDFRLEYATDSCFVEVKNVTMPDGDTGVAFPDSITERGTRHLKELIDIVASGQRATLLFCCSRSGATTVRPADEIDRRYGQTLRDAHAAGVLLLAYSCSVLHASGRWHISLENPLPIDFLVDAVGS